ncbi:MAG: bifunctional riboflavin kinase/FMN adenylyltransferase [Planctomycetota bacterium]|nr:bifunctional riboflavin kinase/FMN adenylyltransferase [Planctomycetota bacterium]
MAGSAAITIGVFDGVHLGHASLVRRARELAGESSGGTKDGPHGSGGRVVVMTFDPHPLEALRPEIAPPRLSTMAQRRRWLHDLGADEVVELAPTPDLLALEPAEFVDQILMTHQPGWIVEGADFRFGAARRGGVDTLKQLGASRAFKTDVLNAVDATLSDQTIVRASSSIARWLIHQGRMRDAAILLGRPYEIEGSVVEGARRGREIGCPTANIAAPHLAPAHGVYVGAATLPDGRELPAAISVGDNPTFNGSRVSVEAHLLEEDGRPWSGGAEHGLPEYGWDIRLCIESWLRGQIRYTSVPPLVDQIRRDIDRTMTWWDRRGSVAGRSQSLQESIA